MSPLLQLLEMRPLIPACILHHSTIHYYGPLGVPALCYYPPMKRTSYLPKHPAAFLLDTVRHKKGTIATIRSQDVFALPNMFPSLKMFPTTNKHPPLQTCHF